MKRPMRARQLAGLLLGLLVGVGVGYDDFAFGLGIGLTFGICLYVVLGRARVSRAAEESLVNSGTLTEDGGDCS